MKSIFQSTNKVHNYWKITLEKTRQRRCQQTFSLEMSKNKINIPVNQKSSQLLEITLEETRQRRCQPTFSFETSKNKNIPVRVTKSLKKTSLYNSLSKLNALLLVFSEKLESAMMVSLPVRACKQFRSEQVESSCQANLLIAFEWAELHSEHVQLQTAVWTEKLLKHCAKHI